MSENYDCTHDVREHQSKVKYWLSSFIHILQGRSESHDQSKLKDPAEKALFDYWSPELRRLTFGTFEYKLALDGMGEGVKRHYRANRHHPEHYENGVNGMTLVDLMEMVADWMAAAEARGTHVDLENAKTRFGLSDQLIEIIANTLREEDLWCTINGCGRDLCPLDRRDGHVEGFERPGKDGE